MDNDSMEFYNSKLLRFHKTSKGLMDRREREGVINGVSSDIVVDWLGEHTPGETAETGWLLIWKEQAGAHCWGGWDAGRREDVYFHCQTEEYCGRTGLEFDIVLIWK